MRLCYSALDGTFLGKSHKRFELWIYRHKARLLDFVKHGGCLCICISYHGDADYRPPYLQFLPDEINVLRRFGRHAWAPINWSTDTPLGAATASKIAALEDQGGSADQYIYYSGSAWKTIGKSGTYPLCVFRQYGQGQIIVFSDSFSSGSGYHNQAFAEALLETYTLNSRVARSASNSSSNRMNTLQSEGSEPDRLPAISPQQKQPQQAAEVELGENLRGIWRAAHSFEYFDHRKKYRPYDAWESFYMDRTTLRKAIYIYPGGETRFEPDTYNPTMNILMIDDIAREWSSYTDPRYQSPDGNEVEYTITAKNEICIRLRAMFGGHFSGPKREVLSISPEHMVWSFVYKHPYNEYVSTYIVTWKRVSRIPSRTKFDQLIEGGSQAQSNYTNQEKQHPHWKSTVVSDFRDFIGQLKSSMSTGQHYQGSTGDKVVEGMIQFATPEADESARKVLRPAVKWLYDPNAQRSEQHFQQMVTEVEKSFK